MQKYILDNTPLRRLAINSGLVILFLFCNGGILQAGQKDAGGVAVFGIPSRNKMLNTLSYESISRIKRVFNELGRFRPVERNRLKWAFQKLEGNDGKGDTYDKAAKLIGVDIYIVVAVFQVASTSYAEVRVVALNQVYKGVEKKFNVRSKVALNLSLKIGREIAYLHRMLPVRARIVRRYKDNLYLMNTGQWHGIEKGTYETAQDDGLNIIEVGRFESIARIKECSKDTGESVIIRIYPDVKGIVNKLERRITGNTVMRYGLGNSLLKGDDPEKKLLEGICVVNMCGNVCLPGYSSFLSSGYLGFKNASPNFPGIAVSVATITMQICLPSIMNDFKINMLPWLSDSDKDEKTEDLQIFLWSTLPLTFSVAYLDQLAYQFMLTEHLPPFFNDKDLAAAGFSVFIPGGGHFYKGFRLLGWSFYFSEMVLAGYGVYNSDSRMKKLCAFSALGVIKIIDIVYAYAVKSSYAFYNIEMEREIQRASLNIWFDRINDENVWSLLIAYRF